MLETVTHSFIMPGGRWCNIITYEYVTVSNLSDVTLPTDASSLNLHLRPGHIIPLQRDAEEAKVNTTVDLNNMPMGLMINPLVDSKASGEFYADDGVSENPDRYTHIKLDFEYDGNAANITFNQISNNYTGAEYTKLKTIEIVGANIKNLYNLTKMKINGGETIEGKCYSILTLCL